MQVIHQRCCGLDVHKKTVVACLLISDGGVPVQKIVRTFSTMTADLVALSDWLITHQCTHVAMESTGVYWKPVFNLLEALMTVLVVNAHHIKAVPGRKTDVRDAEWIADLLRHGLLQGSCIPTSGQRQLRDLTRHRTTLVQERARILNRLQKVLEDANIKLAAVATDVAGRSAREMLEALIAGETDPIVMADLARGKLRAKREQLERALEGRVTDHHRFLLTEHLSHLDYLEESIERFTTEIGAQLTSDEEVVMLIDSIPGFSRRSAEIILAEIGADMSRFPSAAHLASWAGMCPGNHESAGKRKSGKTRKGSRWLRQVLIEAANSLARSKKTYLSALYRRIAMRRGHKKALVAVGHALLVIIYHVLRRKEPYRDLGANYFDERDRQSVQRRLVQRLERLGYNVTLQAASIPAGGGFSE
jgi:transposase